MQQYIVRNYEVIAIIDSETERFFPAASVNTTIVILRKQRNEDIRNDNLVKFIYLNSSLADVINIYKGTQEFCRTIENSNENINNHVFNLNCIRQHSLRNFTKWGQFFKAPKLYFTLLERGKDLFVPLHTCAIVKYGIKTGSNKFFILEDLTDTENSNFLPFTINNIEQFKNIKNIHEYGLRIVKNGFNEIWLIEKQFLFPILTSPKDVKSYYLEPLNLR